MQKNLHPRSIVLQNLRKVFWLNLVLSTTVVIADIFFKRLALTHLSEGAPDSFSLLSFFLHKNMGIIFNIPIPISLVVIASFAVIGILIWWSIKNKSITEITVGSTLIVVGAIGNLIDRIQYGFTIDYIILFGRSAINLADILIFIGIGLLFFTQKKHRLFDNQTKN